MKTMRILIVDDEIVALKSLKIRVDWMQWGFTDVLTAENAAQARQLMEKYPADLVLCDIEMPGESGLSLIKYIRETYPETECIMVTCHADFNYIKQAMKYRASDYLLKPIDDVELNELLMQFVKKKENEKSRRWIGKIVEETQENRGEDETEPGERIYIVKKYIDEHLRNKIYAEDLARLVHVNEQYLMRLFKRYEGQSLTEYIIQQRILAASRLLKDTDYSINFIADCVGCGENYSYFSRLFKKVTGLTPREYRVRFSGKK